MNWFTAITGALTALAGPFKYLVTEVRGWAERKDVLRKAELDASVAEIRAKAELAAWKVKADVEWDLTWAGQAQSSWKDEYLLILWSIPLLPVILAVLFPGYRDDFMETLGFFQQLNPDIIPFYLMGWSIIFAATFGLKQATQMMLPGRLGKMVEAISGAPDDIPEKAVESVTARIKKDLGK